MFCIHCGTDMPTGSEFCSGCGRPTNGGRPGSTLSGAARGAGASISGIASASPTAPVYAGFWMRFIAMIIDSFVLMPLGLLLILPFALFLPAGRESPELGGVFSGIVLIIALLLVAAGWLYYTVMESSRHQATLGKKVLGLAVTDTDGRRISFGRANGRFFGKYLSGLIFNVGYILAGFTEKKQALHDMIASCLVVRR